MSGVEKLFNGESKTGIGHLKDTVSSILDPCVFCQKLQAIESDVEYEGSGVYSFVPLNPVTPGHRLFVMGSHCEYPHEDPIGFGNTMIRASLYAKDAGENYNLIVNAGPNASQTINHVHIHYVPRRKDDGLKLPWTDQEKK